MEADMDVATARTIWGTIDKTTLENLKMDLFRKAVAYARIRSEWFFHDTEQRKEQDRVRTLAHNAFIDACNILSRNMAKVGEDNKWREMLTNDRKTIGDFACWLHALIGISMR
jgi:hypothetical protein